MKPPRCDTQTYLGAEMLKLWMATFLAGMQAGSSDEMARDIADSAVNSATERFF